MVEVVTLRSREDTSRAQPRSKVGDEGKGGECEGGDSGDGGGSATRDR
jgi:hypothetical protein